MTLSVIIPHYQGTVSDEEFHDCIDSLLEQEYQPEVLCYHDGPLLRTEHARIFPTDKRFNDYGHSLRDRGIREAKGDYLLFLNADNILYPGVLKPLVEEIESSKKPIYICNLIMRGCVSRERDGQRYLQVTGNHRDMVKLTGIPPKYRNIDCMQLIMRRDLWKKYGGWYDKSQNSDGPMYERFCKENEYKHLDIVLGEHR